MILHITRKETKMRVVFYNQAKPQSEAMLSLSPTLLISSSRAC